MKSNKQIYDELRQNYTLEEIADFAMIPAEVDEEASKQARDEFVVLRMKRRAEMSKQDRLLSGLLSIKYQICLLYTSPSPRDLSTSRMPSSA